MIAYIHVRDGNLVGGNVSQRGCGAGFTIFSPVDHNIRKAIIIPTPGKPHNHPSFPMQKLTYEARVKYEAAIDQAGILGAMVQRVDTGKCVTVRYYL